MPSRAPGPILRTKEKSKVNHNPTDSPVPPAWGFPGGSVGKEYTCNARHAGDTGSISVSGRSPGEEDGYPLQYSGLENSMDRRA